VKAVAATALLAPAFRVALVLWGGNEVTVRTPVFSCLDALGAGSLLALLWAAHPDGRGWRPLLYRVGLFAALPLAVALLAARAAETRFGALGWGEELYLALCNTPLAVAFAALVDKAARGFGGRFGAVLRWPPLGYVGRISYGLYVYHLFTPRLLWKLTDWLDVPHPRSGAAVFRCALAFALAAASWHLMESPVNRLKAYFPYRRRRRAGVQPAGTCGRCGVSRPAASAPGDRCPRCGELASTAVPV
jgi:peptidoglycan/LPS O-acetylase OafA/YrhL